ncbi:MAG: N-6 DNA methylase [Pseudoclavibacter sp.]|nr:N-6 DNA methylase [Pseudoclavibacter sp.]
MTLAPPDAGIDTPALRKARGAFFTPAPIARFLARWAVREAGERVLEPAAGEAAFLVPVVERLRELGGSGASPTVDGVEIHEASARRARRLVQDAGGRARIRVQDFFRIEAAADYDAVVGNPPFIRYQEFTGELRRLARNAAARSGVRLSGLASSWAAFTVHASRFLRPGGRLALVLPAELLSVNYAAPVRALLLERFARVELVLFRERLFPEAETETLLLLASGAGSGPAEGAVFRHARGPAGLERVSAGRSWRPARPGDKWLGGLVTRRASEPLRLLEEQGRFTRLAEWGRTALGIVTGANGYFAMSPARARGLGIGEEELLPLSPPGSSHLRGLEFTAQELERLGEAGRATRLFSPAETMSPAAARYVRRGERAGVHRAYKCRARRVWYRVPLADPADLLLTYMNADAPRLTDNRAGARHLNSVHGVYLHPRLRETGRALLPLASLNSVTLLAAELVGRSYGGGVLKLEPREADEWLVPAPGLLERCRGALDEARAPVAALLRDGRLAGAVRLVDELVLRDGAGLDEGQIAPVRAARQELAARRAARGTRRGRA